MKMYCPDCENNDVKPIADGIIWCDGCRKHQRVTRFQKGEVYGILRRRPQGSWKWQLRVGWDYYLCIADTNNEPDGRRINEWSFKHSTNDFGLCNINSPKYTEYFSEIGSIIED